MLALMFAVMAATNPQRTVAVAGTFHGNDVTVTGTFYSPQDRPLSGEPTTCTGQQQSTCSAQCEASLSNPYCVVVGAECTLNPNRCYCYIFCVTTQGGKTHSPNETFPEIQAPQDTTN